MTVSSQEDNDLPSESDLRARLVALMGGRAAEELLFHEVTGGASNDFEEANQIAVAMVTRWGMGRDPEATDHGVSGRGSLSFLVPRPAAGACRPRSRPRPRARSGRSSTAPTPRPAGRSIDNMETLRRIAAYLVEHERVDGETFDELFDGRRVVHNAGDEWRAATARPRAWGDVVDLAAHRARPVPLIAAVVAAELEASAIAAAQAPALAPTNIASVAARPIRATGQSARGRTPGGRTWHRTPGRNRLSSAAPSRSRNAGPSPGVAAPDRARGRPALGWSRHVWYRWRS